LFYRICQFLLYCIFKVWNRIELRGSEFLPDKSTGFILAANHTSYLDPPVLGGRIRRQLGFMAKEKLFKIPVLGTMITWLGSLPIAGDSDFKSMRVVIRALKAGKAVVIFPEGTRSAGEEFLDPQPGVAFLAHAAHVPIVPCYIEGTAKAWPRGRKAFRPVKIRVIVGKPIPVANGDIEDKLSHYEKTAAIVMDRIRELKTQSHHQ
jgi:1-acyl-sn-glycerol-3-phosphate acyltransferase